MCATQRFCVSVICPGLTLVITRAIKSTSRKKLYQNLKLNIFSEEDWWEVYACFIKMLLHISDLVPPMRNTLRYPSKFNIFSCRTDYLKKYSSLSTVTEWSKLDLQIQNSSIDSIFFKALIKFIKFIVSKTYIIHVRIGQKLLIGLYVGFNPLREHKFKHSFNHTLNPLSSCNIETESITS